MGQPHRIGIIGLGVISRQYLDTFAEASGIEITAVADLDTARAREVADALPAARAMTVDELVTDSRVQTVLNLTIPRAHAEIALAAIPQGKAVYGEKPLAATLDQSREMVDAAERAGVAIGCAPDTVLGTGIQTARAAIGDAVIGRPVSATATFVSAGPEPWHPHPDFYYQPGGGPLLDMGPYYITSLLHLLGPVSSVVGVSSRTRSVRTIGSGPRQGEVIPVEIDTHVTGVLEHTDGALSTVTFSFDGAGTGANPIEVHGESGSLAVPDPNEFAGDVSLRRPGSREWELLAPRAGYADASRGVGLIDFVSGRVDAGRASGRVALHALDVMTGLLRSAREGGRVSIESTMQPPALVPLTPAEQWRRY